MVSSYNGYSHFLKFPIISINAIFKNLLSHLQDQKKDMMETYSIFIM